MTMGFTDISTHKGKVRQNAKTFRDIGLVAALMETFEAITEKQNRLLNFTLIEQGTRVDLLNGRQDKVSVSLSTELRAKLRSFTGRTRQRIRLRHLGIRLGEKNHGN